MSRRRSTFRRRKRRTLAFTANELAADPSSINSETTIGDRRDKSSTASSKFQNDYMRQTLRPVVCLAFVLPMILAYELGLIFTDQLSAKSGIDQWLCCFMDWFGVGHLVVLPLLTAGILLYWHHRIHDHWQLKASVLFGMLAESFCLGGILFFAGNALYQFFATDLPNAGMFGSGETSLVVASSWSTTIAFVGSGVYEELIFRLILLSGLIYVGNFYLPERESRFISIVLTSLIFAAVHFHFFNPAGAAFDAQGFFFRFFASLIFCILFLCRGFGVAVGTHVVYDVMTQL